jgi:hypothetical protein
MPSLEAHPRATRRRIARFRRYMDQHVLGPDGFVCHRFSECRRSRRKGDSFFQGQLSHVGHRYDLSLDGRPLRVVVVGQEYAFNSIVDGRLKRRRVTLDERYRMIEVSGLDRRYFATAEHPSRNPHMRGTTQALRLLFGAGLGSDHEGEWIEPAEGHEFHIFDGFALVNRLLCAAGLPGDGQGRSTRTMRENCLEHFNASLEILEPTVLILQGEGVQSWTADALSDEEPITPYLSWAQHAGGRALVCRFSHPSARGDKRWGDRTHSPYLLEVVRPTMRAVRRRL